MAARDFSADWVINSDVDEFWWPLDGNLKAVFSAAPTDCGVLLAHRLNFLPMRTLATAFWREMVWRYVVPKHLEKFPRAHVIITFAENLPGPLAIGSGRHSGLGAFAALDESSSTA